MSDDGDLKMYFDFQQKNNIIIYLKISLQRQCKN